jgi:hypothetical protein
MINIIKLILIAMMTMTSAHGESLGVQLTNANDGQALILNGHEDIQDGLIDCS